jgi:hypothetical protein
LIALGTSAATAELAAGAAAEDDALVVGAAADDVAELLLLLLLPHPTIAAALSSETVAESQVLGVLIELLLIEFVYSSPEDMQHRLYGSERLIRGQQGLAFGRWRFGSICLPHYASARASMSWR